VIKEGDVRLIIAGETKLSHLVVLSDALLISRPLSRVDLSGMRQRSAPHLLRCPFSSI
jgi:hypothetical protein